MLKKGILLSAVVIAIMCLSVGEAEARRGIVVPTAYGYGVVGSQIPYLWPAYGYSGMHPTISVPFANGIPAPAWNGATWSYQNAVYPNTTYPVAGYPAANYSGSAQAVVGCNMNIRSEPYVAGRKKRAANVIGSLNAGEQVYILGRDGNWSYIQSANLPLRRGYVYSSYLRVYQNNLPASNYPAFYPTPLYTRGW